MIHLFNRHVVQPWMARRAGSSHLQLLKQLEKRQFDSPAEIAERQRLAVQAMLRHAFETVPFYRQRFSEVGFHPNDFQTLSNLQHIPVLTKQDIRQHGPALRSEAYRDVPTLRKTTSGSTGVPLEIFVDYPAVWWKMACTLRSDQWSGWTLGQRVAKVWGNPEYQSRGRRGQLRNYFVDRATYLDTLVMDEARIADFVKRLQKKQPGLLFGHAHSLYLLANYVQKNAPGTIHPGGIISTAMMLHDWQRQVIEAAFGVPVTNRYGCEEVSLIASECEAHQGLHLNADSIYAEVIADPTLEIDGPAGALVITDLTNRAMPLIRYQVGDVVVPSTRTCSCGRGLPMIEKVIGREADYVVTPAGKWISGISLTENFAMHIRGAAQLQIVQETLRFVRLRMVPGIDFGTESRNQIAQLVQQTFGDEMRYEVELVEKIPQEKSGKYRFCISKVAHESMKAMAR